MSEPQSGSPKIIVDEDWKTRVAAEKEALAAKEAAEAKEAGPVAAGEPSGARESTGTPVHGGDSSRAEAPAPPATLSFLVTTLATQAMVALGEMTHPLTNKHEVRLAEARHFIDILDMLEEKTAGNRTPEESALFDALLHQLRLSYVDRLSHGAQKN